MQDFLKKLNKPKALAFAGLFTLLAFLCIHYYRNTITEHPSGIHTWAQSDREALAYGFIHNGMDFFHPETYSLIKFFGKKGYSREDAIVGVDFPIHSYVVAWLMKISGSRSPAVYRFYTLLYSLIGLIFLFLTVWRYSRFKMLAFPVVLFVFCAPVFSFYQDGFLQSIPSIANLFIGLYFYLRYREEGRPRNFTLSIVFFTLAALARITFTAFLFGILLIELFFILRARKISRFHWIVIPVSGLFVLLNYFYFNKYLSQEHGSIFLGNLRPPQSWEHFKLLWDTAMSRWGQQYFTWYHYKALLLFPLLGLLSWFWPGKGGRNTMAMIPLLLAGIVLPFCFAFIYFLAGQVPDHDYYILDMVFPFFCMGILAFALMIKPGVEWAKWGTGLLLGLLCFGFVEQNNHVQSGRRNNGIEFEKNPEVKSFRTGGAAILKSAKVPDEAVLAIMHAMGPNYPQVLLDRKAIAFVQVNPDYLQELLKAPFDYLLADKNTVLPELIGLSDELQKQMRLVESDEGLFLFMRIKPADPISINEFLGLKDLSESYSFLHSFDSVQSQIRNERFPAAFTDSSRIGKFGRIIPGEEFPLSFELPSEELPKGGAYLKVTFFFRSQENPGNLELILNAENSQKEKTHFKSTQLGRFVKKTGEWTEVNLWFALPALTDPGEKLFFYFWNKDKISFDLDDFGFRIYPKGK